LSLEERTEYKKKRDGIARTFVLYTHQMLDGSNIPKRTREPYPLPTLKIVGYPEEYNHPNDERLFEEFDISDFELENYQSHPAIKLPLSN
jgi:thymidylate synthase